MPPKTIMDTHSNSLAVSAALRAALGYYRLVAEIGRGGMSSVFLALFPNGDGTSRKVVLKQLQPELAMDDDFRTNFEDQARLATRLHHPNVVETFDIYSDHDLCVLVMEFLEGQTLSCVRQRARKVNNVPASIHLRVLAEVLAGLLYVHELTDEDGTPLGIVHRDVTPSNVFITYDGRVKVVDFGIAKATTRIAERRIGVLKGRLAYMSPETVSGELADKRSDIFSVGVMAWEAATGLRLWQDHDEVAIYRRLASGDLPLYPPGAEIANPELFRIAKRALAVDPNQRYQSAEEMRLEIENLLVQLGKLTGAPALSAYMESFFTVEREKFQLIVDEALARFPTKPVSQRRLLANELSDSYPALDASEPEPTTTVSTPSGGTFRTTSYDVPLDVRDVPDFRLRGRSLMLGAVAATLALGVAILAHAPPDAPWSAPATPMPSTTISAPALAGPLGPVESQTLAPAARPATDLAAPAPEPIVTIVLSARPVEARFYLDGEPIEGNPLTLRRRVDDKKHRVRVEAPGYVALWRPIDFDRDVTREFDLEPYVPPPTGMARPARPVEPREEPAGLPKPRRGKRTLDREDPWGI